jgi:cytosine/adenosine deaminase-related metal-dependent hydrolase
MRFLQADQIFNGQTFLNPGHVLVLDDRNNLVESISEDQVEKLNIHRLEGILTPGFVNTHCHLELSHLQGKIPRHTGLPTFGKQVITLRSQLRQEEIAEHMQEADQNMWERGIVAVGDISNDHSSFEVKANSKINYHTFIELIGLKPEGASAIFEKGLELHSLLKEYGIHGSLSPHAPYSTSKELIALISEFDQKNNFPLSIHNQESEEEHKFFFGEPNGFTELFQFLNLDLSWYKAPKTSSLKYYAESLTAKKNILVHNTCSSKEDLETVSGKGIYWCFCPAANAYIENAHPDYSLFQAYLANLCLGTDSLASNHTLDLISEANLILSATKIFSLENMLQFMTFNSAQALNLQDEFGQLLSRKNTGLNQLTFSNNSLTFIKKIV